MKEHLTQTKVSWLKAPAKGHLDVWDDAIAGFAVRVHNSGVRSYWVRYRDAAGKPKRITLGSAETLTADDARKLARLRLGEVAMGADPAAARREARKGITFDQLADAFLNEHRKRNGRPKKSLPEDAKKIRCILLPAWRGRLAKTITEDDVYAVLKTLADRGALVQANRTRSLISVLFNFGRKRRPRLVTHNPAMAVEKPLSDETPRKRSLIDGEDGNASELRSFWRALDGESENHAAIFKLIILTSRRPGEVWSATWDQFDLERKSWTLLDPKNGREHRLPLVGAAWELINRRFNAAPRNAVYVFVDGDELEPLAFAALHCAWRICRAFGWRWSDAIDSLDVYTARNSIAERAGIAGFQPKDLRRTAATGMDLLGISEGTIERILNHVPPKSNLLRHVYSTARHYDRMRADLLKWDRWVTEIATGEHAPKVVELRPAAA
jgi:integrase